VQHNAPLPGGLPGSLRVAGRPIRTVPSPAAFHRQATLMAAVDGEMSWQC
jgi:hypothetical protein